MKIKQRIFENTKRRHLSALSLLLFFTLLFVFGAKSYADELPPRHLYLGVDAVPFHIFVEAQERGLFKDFHPPSKTISVFPSLSNYAWAVILNTEELESYQARYYHYGLNRIVGRLLQEVSKPTYPNKFDYADFKVIKKIKAYVTGGGTVKGEMRHLSRKILASNKPRLFFCLIYTSDIVAHMKGAKGLHKLLKTVDQELLAIRKVHLEKFKEPLVVTLISDHGNTLTSGKIINVDKALEGSHFHLTKTVKGPDDVVYYSSGMLSVANFFIQDERKIELAKILSTQPWADLVVTLDKEKGVFLVISQKGTSAFEYKEERNEFRITDLAGEDPLGLVEQGLPVGQWIPQSEVFKASVKTHYPDSLMRIQRGLTRRGVHHPASVTVSLKIGCESGNKFMKFLSKFKGRSGTHGGLAYPESVGFMSSTDYMFPEWVSAYEVHNLIKGHDFEKRFEAMTLISEGGGKCIIRFGQPLLDIPDVASVQFTLQTFDHQKHEFSKSYDLYELKIPSRISDVSLHGQARFFDVALPKTLEPEVLYQVKAQVFDANHKVVAQLKPKRFELMLYKTYILFPIW